jgi:hypothetical protein
VNLWTLAGTSTYSPTSGFSGGFNSVPGIWNGSGSVSDSSTISSSSTTAASNSANMTRAELIEQERKKNEAETVQHKAEINQKSMLRRGCSDNTTLYTMEDGTTEEVYADENGNPIKYKYDENGKLVLGTDGKPIEDTEGMPVPVMDLKNIQKKKEELVNAKKDDDSAVTSMSADEYTKKVPWYKRLGRAAGNMLSGTWKMAKSLVGFDENGKWSPTKALTNAAILVAGIALTAVCPAAGPVLLYAGLAMGAAKVGVGTYKAFTAKNVEEIDNAWQDVGVGIATVVASRNGLKGLSKSTGVSMYSPKELVANQAQKGAINFAGGKLNWDKTQLPKMPKASDFKTGTKKKQNFETAQQTAETSCETKIAELEAKLNEPTITPEEKALIQNEKTMFETHLSELKAAKTQSDYATLGSNSKIHEALKANETALNTLRANPSADTAQIQMVESRIAAYKQLTKELENLTAAKNSYMKHLAWRPTKKNADALKDWTGAKRVYNASLKTLGKTKKGLAGEGLNLGFNVLNCPEFLLWSPLTRKPFMVPFKGVDLFAYKHDYREGGMFDTYLAPEALTRYTKEEVDAQLLAYDQQIAEIEKELKA